MKLEKGLRSLTCDKVKNVRNSKNIGHSDLVISVCLALVPMYITVQILNG